MKRLDARKFANAITYLFELARLDADGRMPRNREQWRPFVLRTKPHIEHHQTMDEFKLGLAHLLQRPELEVGRFSDSIASLEEYEMREAAEHTFAILWPDDDWRTVPTDDVAFSD